MSVLSIWKKEGETPLEALTRLKKAYPEFESSKLTYAGRLDPLASGVMVVLTDKDVLEKEKYLNLPKEYELEVLFGVKTDTDDVLGLVEEVKSAFLDLEKIKESLPDFLGKYKQEYPKFSSPKIDGLKQFSKEVEVKNITWQGSKEIEKDFLLKNIYSRVFAVKPSFRQEEIWDKWQEIKPSLVDHLVTVSLMVECSAGTYMRVLAEEIGGKQNLPSLAFRIKRTKVGEFNQGSCLSL